MSSPKEKNQKPSQQPESPPQKAPEKQPKQEPTIDVEQSIKVEQSGENQEDSVKNVSTLDDATLKATPWEKLKRIISMAESIVEIVVEKDFEALPGSIDGHMLAYAPVINDPEFGDSSVKKVPFVLRILVQDEQIGTDPVHIGKLGKDMVFPEYPRFQFNVAASVGESTSNGGVYGDPSSIWFNVFLGFYEIVAKEKDGWTRPFGYEEDGTTINKEDFARLFCVDWNLFSAFMYGVGMDYVQPYTDLTTVLENLDTNVTVADERKEVNGKYFDSVSLHKHPSVTAYQSKKHNASKLTKTSNYTPFWQKAFGYPLDKTSDEFPDSFIPSKMTGVEWCAWSKKGDAYHTIIFGGGFVNSSQVEAGVVSQDQNDRFMQVQMNATEKCIIEQFPDVGFTSATGSE